MVARMRSLWVRETARRNQLMTAALAGVAIGVLLIVIGAIADWGWTRIVGAMLITVGGGTLGTLVGLSAPHRQQARAWIIERRTLIALIAAAIIVVPVILALVAAVIGLFARGGGRGGAALAGGTVIALFLLAASLFSALIAIRAVRRATYNRAERPGAGGGM